jgi:hypothetical protein
MASPVDPNNVLMTGENSFIRLSHDGGQTLATRFSHWRVLWCAAGSGHALFAQSELTDGKTRIYSDNAAEPTIPVISATFARSGDARSTAVESIDSATDHIRMTWWDTLEPFVLTMAPGTNNRPIGVFSTFFPARSAQIELNGRFAAGQVWAEKRGDRDSSSACLAWSETWVKPRA